jgi:Reverse transcriptase (RNA-dependent DNA polymerase)
MDVQVRAVKEGQTWEEIPKAKVPQGAQILCGRWVYTEKDGDNEKIQKTRWVMRGFEEKETNWDDLSAATVKAQTTRILFALAAQKIGRLSKWMLWQRF